MTAGDGTPVVSCPPPMDAQRALIMLSHSLACTLKEVVNRTGKFKTRGAADGAKTASFTCGLREMSASLA